MAKVKQINLKRITITKRGGEHLSYSRGSCTLSAVPSKQIVVGDAPDLQDGQISLKLVVGHLNPVIVPLYPLVLDEGMEGMVTKSFADNLTLFSELDSLPEAGG